MPGDIVALAAGDMIPADVRVLTAKDLFLNQSALTGESLPVEKTVAVVDASVQNPLEMTNICFLGSNIESGTARRWSFRPAVGPISVPWRTASPGNAC